MVPSEATDICKIHAKVAAVARPPFPVAAEEPVPEEK
jgi:hypothetical protein